MSDSFGLPRERLESFQFDFDQWSPAASITDWGPLQFALAWSDEIQHRFVAESPAELVAALLSYEPIVRERAPREIRYWISQTKWRTRTKKCKSVLYDLPAALLIDPTNSGIFYTMSADPKSYDEPGTLECMLRRSIALFSPRRSEITVEWAELIWRTSVDHEIWYLDRLAGVTERISRIAWRQSP